MDHAFMVSLKGHLQKCNSALGTTRYRIYDKRDVRNNTLMRSNNALPSSK